jgi:glycosyltransferase involved in cell wall biosynthesis
MPAKQEFLMSMVSRIVILGPAYPLRGGIADFNQALCSNFIKKGIDCKIVSFSYQYPSVLFPGQTQYVPEGTPKPDMEIYPVLNSINPLTWTRTARKIKEFNPDFVLSSYWLPLTGLSMAKVLKKLKKHFVTISLAHNVIPHQNMPFDRAITKFYVKQNQGFVVLSEAVANDLDEFDNKVPRIVVPHPVYEIFGSPVSKQEALKKLGLTEGNYVLFFGIIKPYKGLKYLLQAFATEEIRKADIKLIIAGEFYEDDKPYKKMIKDSGIEDQVILHDKFIPNGDVKYYFSVADVVVQPYLSATQSGITQVAYNFDKPMIVTDVGGLKEIVIDGKTGYVVPKENPDALSRAIIDFYNSRQDVDFEKNVREVKKKFSWDSFTDKVIELYERIGF